MEIKKIILAYEEITNNYCSKLCFSKLLRKTFISVLQFVEQFTKY